MGAASDPMGGTDDAEAMERRRATADGGARARTAMPLVNRRLSWTVVDR
ncbi:hypothetical protein [Streptomyces sp. NBC_00829]|nr:hypothetical protein OG293_34945 [Streptomyces sp. NBC_00829]